MHACMAWLIDSRSVWYGIYLAVTLSGLCHSVLTTPMQPSNGLVRSGAEQLPEHYEVLLGQEGASL
jgi:hypothetical protein